MQTGAAKLNELGYTTDAKYPWPALAGEPTSAYDTLLYGKFTPERMAIREQAAIVLSNYGDALLALVNYDGSQDLQSAAGALSTSIKGLPPSLKVISDADADILASLVQQLGGILIEKKKADAVRTIVPKYQPQVVKLCGLLAADFDPTKGELTTEYIELARTIREDEVQTLDRNGSRIDVRARALPTFDVSSREYFWARNTLPEVAKAGDKCISASAALEEAVTDREYSLADIQSFAAQVQKLYSTALKWK
jgi:hypothetical protein